MASQGLNELIEKKNDHNKDFASGKIIQSIFQRQFLTFLVCFYKLFRTN